MSGEKRLWFHQDLRLGFAGPDCKMTSDKEAWMRGSDFIRHSDPDLVTFQTGYASLFGGMARGIDTSVATTERITCLCGLWRQKNATSGETCAGTDFQQAAYEVLYECVGSMCKVFEHTQAKTRNVKQNLTILPECKKSLSDFACSWRNPWTVHWFPNIGLIKQSNTNLKGTHWVVGDCSTSK